MLYDGDFALPWAGFLVEPAFRAVEDLIPDPAPTVRTVAATLAITVHWMCLAWGAVTLAPLVQRVVRQHRGDT